MADGIKAHRLRLLGMLCLALTILPGAGDSSARVDKLGHKLICMCGCGQVLLECNHYGCPYLTPESQELVAAVDKGKSDEDTLHAFVDEYGPTVLAAPPFGGFNRVAWLMPYIALALGIFGLVLVVKNWKGRPELATAKRESLAGPDLDRFREQARRETDL